jgi:hypothetical protein
MEYIINLNQKDVIDIIAEKFNISNNQVTFNYEVPEDRGIEVKFNKDVKNPERKIGFN